MLAQVLLRFLHHFSPERAHHIVIFLLKWYQRLLRFKPTSRLGSPAIHIPHLSHLAFTSRLGLAAGFDKNAEVFAGLSHLGFGFIEVGTVTPLAQSGNPKPRIWRKSDRALVNSLGFNNVGLKKFHRNLRGLRNRSICPILANIGKGRDTANEAAISDYERGFRALEHSVDGFVVNVSSPNTPQLFQLQTEQFIEDLGLVAPQGLPIFVKLSPDLSNQQLAALCRMVAEHAKFAGVVLTNTSRALAQHLNMPTGGLSGPPLFARALECVALAKEQLKERKALIGVGGVSSRLDYQRMRSAGADLVEVYTGFVYHGPNWIREMAREASIVEG